MKVLELFAGTCCLSKGFKKRGHEIFTIDNDPKFDVSWCMDVSKITTEDILEKFGIPDVIWIGTPCQSYSIAAISHHRRKNQETGNLDPVSDFAKFCDDMNWHVRHLVEDLTKLNPNLIYIWENPRSGFRKMDFIQGIPRYTTTYCQYGFSYMKPTDFFSNIDLKLKPPCKNGDSCHMQAKRGSKSGLQGVKGAMLRSMYPEKLIEHIVDICEEVNENKGE